MDCRYCHEEIKDNAIPTFSYWNAIKFYCHLECKNEGERQEAIECQSIDADCNDCFFFERKFMPTKKDWEGNCRKKGRSVIAHPKLWSGRECFMHRKLYGK